jgi:hypothetical protein
MLLLLVFHELLETNTCFAFKVCSVGVFNKRFSLLDICHVVGTVQLYKYLPLSTVIKCDESQTNHRCQFTCQVEICCCVPTTRLTLTSRQVTCV